MRPNVKKLLVRDQPCLRYPVNLLTANAADGIDGWFYWIGLLYWPRT